VRVTGSRGLKTLRGSLDQVVAEGELAGDCYLRVILAEPSRAGLGDLVRDKLPNTLEVLLDDAHRPHPGQHGPGQHGPGQHGTSRVSRIDRSPAQLFGDYLAEQSVADPRLNALFAELLDEITGSADGAELAEAESAGTAGGN